jgi:nicotinamidase-related amidase
MGKSALVIVDTQVNMFDEAFSVYDGKHILETIRGLIDMARAAQADVIYIRNNGPAGEPDEPGTPGWQLHPAISPEPGDLIIDKEGADPFEGTEFQAALDSRGIERLIVSGMQTELCVANTVRQAAKRGYAVTVAEDGHTTFDWEEISAVEAIAQHNREFSGIAEVRTAQSVDFR